MSYLDANEKAQLKSLADRNDLLAQAFQDLKNSAPVSTDLSATESGKGAALVGIQDAANKYPATTVEGALANLATAGAANQGANIVGVQDAVGLFTATTVEGALAEAATAVNARRVALISAAAPETDDSAVTVTVKDGHKGVTVAAAAKLCVTVITPTAEDATPDVTIGNVTTGVLNAFQNAAENGKVSQAWITTDANGVAVFHVTHTEAAEDVLVKVETENGWSSMATITFS